jgi:5-methyltetrahydropteroyltriglutamate--homocysteine methyltransferase
MTDLKFETREIGSLAKPPWRVKAFAGRPIEEGDVAEAERLAQKLELDGTEELVEVLRRAEIGKDDLRLVDDWSSRYGLALLERAGLDVVYDGEQRRTEMYDHVIRHARGFEQRGTVRSFDNKYYSKAACVEEPSIDGPYDVDEYRFLAARTDRRLKVPFTGPYTVVDWSYDEHYGRHGALGATAEQRADARRRFMLDVAERVVRPNAAAVVEAGCDWIQFDEPALTTRPDEVAFGVEAFNASVEGVPAARRSLHVCFSDYSLLFPHVLELDDCFELQLEFANRDSHDLGTDGADRPGYEPLFLFADQEDAPNVGLGVLDIHTNFVEPAELVRDRIVYAAELLGPERVSVNPDCGLRTRSWDVAYEKLANMVEGTRLAEEALNRAHAGSR